ncbi:cytochrome c oxidase assembly protein [Actinomadura montaniterrae]|uniref:Bifunctional copper resistance protein CopD/cytochrome c oxidase assembly protein n=1 Tax=Actinomadura montaniterrae TaxID=1803903 RepID=A0A6L3VUR3_9ACTN|nr:cytochrome c oxidase assembly protein [Actinomadura montaniterrae]KAB2377446.1 bifunctional copper resistance protein CopD/cytochrome c oxidase assembly protein [Actinomadura montaniterrae]
MATQPRQAPGTDRPLLVTVALAAALLVLALVVRLGGSLGAAAAPGLSEAGALTETGLAVAKLGVNAASTVTVGWLLAAAVYVPATDAARRCLRAASLSALAWALCTLALAAFSVSDLFGIGLTGISGDMLRAFLIDLPQGRALVLVFATAAALWWTARLPAAPGAAGYLLLAAVAGLMPPLFTGHAATGSHHALAVFSLAAHIAGAALWIGGLVALVLLAPEIRDRLPRVVERYSGLALVAFTVVGVSGAVNAWIRLGGLHLGSRYGALIVAKAAALVALGAMGWWHRRATIPALASAPRPFVRLGSAEIVTMAATMALATGLSRTPPPEVSPGTIDAVALRLGFPLPGPAGVAAYLTHWWIDPLFLVLVLLGAVLYGVGVARAGSWPVGRSVAWAAGLSVLLFAMGSGIARYSMVLFSAHALQHVLVGVVAPILLLYGRPLQLVPAGSLPAAAVDSRGVRFLREPAVSSALFLLSLYAYYVSPLFGASLANHALHSLAMACFLTIGLAFFSSVRVPVVLPLLLVAAGIVLMLDGTVLGGGWYEGLGRRWGAAPLHDQHAGAALLWTAAAPAALFHLVRRVRLTRRGRSSPSPVPSR